MIYFIHNIFCNKWKTVTLKFIYTFNFINFLKTEKYKTPKILKFSKLNL